MANIVPARRWACPVATGPEPVKMGNNKQWTNIFCSNFMPSFVLLQSEKKQSRAKFLTSWVRLRSEPNNEKDAFLHSLVTGPSMISKVNCPHQTSDFTIMEKAPTRVFFGLKAHTMTTQFHLIVESSWTFVWSSTGHCPWVYNLMGTQCTHTLC